MIIFGCFAALRKSLGADFGKALTGSLQTDLGKQSEPNGFSAWTSFRTALWDFGSRYQSGGGYVISNSEYWVRNPVQAALPSNKRQKAKIFFEYF